MLSFAVRFVTPVYHPNISESGLICLSILNLKPKARASQAPTFALPAACRSRRPARNASRGSTKDPEEHRPCHSLPGDAIPRGCCSAVRVTGRPHSTSQRARRLAAPRAPTPALHHAAPRSPHFWLTRQH